MSHHIQHGLFVQECSKRLLDRMCTAGDIDAADAWACTALDYCIKRKDAAKSALLAKWGARMDPVLLLHTKRERCARRLQHAV